MGDRAKIIIFQDQVVGFGGRSRLLKSGNMLPGDRKRWAETCPVLLLDACVGQAFVKDVQIRA